MKKTENRIPAEFWQTATGQPLYNVMHHDGWEGLDCLNAQIEALTTASEATTDETIKAELEKAKVKVVAARAACRKAMEILKDGIF
jgi:rRNA-processing protein FCF1